MKEEDEGSRQEVILAGSGGQGLIVAGIILAEAAILEGYNVVQTQSYGIASRGGLSVAEVIMDRREIVYQQVQAPDLILALTQEALDKFLPWADRGATILYDTTLAKAPAGGNLRGCPFTAIAAEMGSAGSVNVLALGAMAACRGLVGPESLAAAVGARFPGKAGEANLRLLKRGKELI